MTNFKLTSLRFSNAAFLLALTSACTTGQIGGEVENGSGNCVDDESVTIVADEETSLGFAAEAVLALVEGKHAATMAWNVPEVSGVAVTPAAGESSIEVSVTPDRKTLRVVKRSPKSSDGATLESGGESCDDELRFDAEIKVVTANGAISDVFQATFSADSGSFAGTSIEVTPGTLSGSFDAVVESPKGAKIEQTSLRLEFTPGGMSGTLGGVVTTDDGQVASAMSSQFAKFPLDACDEGALIGADSEYAASVLATLAGLDSFELTWGAEEPTKLQLVHEVEQYCFVSGADSADRVVVHLTSAATSDDGRIDGSWVLEAQVALDVSGGFESVTLLRQAYLADTYPAAEFEAKTGIKGVSLSAGSSGSFAFTASDDLDGVAAQGTMTILEVAAGSCEGGAPTEDSSGSSAPGCSGAEVTELESAILKGLAN